MNKPTTHLLPDADNTEEHARMMATPYAERPLSAQELEPKPWDELDVDVDVDEEYERANPF